MRPYQIVTDVTVDLPKEILEEFEIPCLPMPLVIDGETYNHYNDYRDVSYEKFYKRLRNGSTASTSQVTQESFRECYEPILNAGIDILFVAFSSGLSGNYQNGVIVAQEMLEKYPERKIITVDTLAASSGEGMLLYYAAKRKQDGASLEELYDWLEENKLKMCHWFTVDDLDFLKRGGRISATAASFGSMLRIKPVMHVDNEGHLIPIHKVRGRKKALNRLYEKVLETGIDIQSQTMFLCQADAYEEAQSLANRLKTEAGVPEVIITQIGPIIGAHAGPGTISIFYFGEHR